MKKLAFNLSYFIFPVLFWIIFSNEILPASTWTYRAWEALRVYNSKLPTGFGPFYPNCKLTMTEQGDLAHHTRFSISKRVMWETDELGFRNKPNSKDKPIDILLIGDSFIAGTSLDQDETLSEQLKRLSGKNVYQIAPCRIEEFDKMRRLNLIPKPKMIIFSPVERNLNQLSCVAKYTVSKRELKRIKLTEHPLIRHTAVLYDRFQKNASYQYVKSRIDGLTGFGTQSVVKPGFFFLRGKKQLAANKFNYDKITEAIKSYKTYCDSLGITFVFLPCPDKESVYYEYVPFNKQPFTLLKLDSMLVANNVNTINTLALFTLNKGKFLLYSYDDAHWNAAGVSVVAAEIMRKYRGLL
jgi:alginate O-acetyltransferase complex protein AlgJ